MNRRELMQRERVTGQVGTGPASLGPPPEARTARQSMYDLSPTMRVLHCGWSYQPTSGNIPAAGAQQPAWLKIGSWNPGLLQLSDFALTGIEANQYPANSTGADLYGIGGTSAAWGSSYAADATRTLGVGAALVIMRNGPNCAVGQFTRAPLDFVLAGGGAFVTQTAADYIRVLTVPPGSIATEPAPKVTLREFSPDSFRFTGNDSLDVYQVFNYNDIATMDAADDVQGYADVALKIRLPWAVQQFR